MFKKIFKRTAMLLLFVVTSYLAIGYLFHLVIFPEKKPSVAGYFKPGQQLYSKAEGVRQTIQKHENGLVFCMSEFEPLAGGPPIHIHTGFDETFAVQNGELSVWVNGEVVKVRPGESVHIPVGVPHKPFNETNETIRIKGTVAFPEQFAFHLAQAYGLMDNWSGFGKSPATMLQLGLLTSEGFDSYIGDGPPVAVQKFMSFLLTPLTRLIGYKSYYPEYDINQSDKISGLRQ